MIRRPTILAAIDRHTSYHAAQQRRHERRYQKTGTEAYRAMASYHAGALAALADLRRIAPAQTRTTSRA